MVLCKNGVPTLCLFLGLVCSWGFGGCGPTSWEIAERRSELERAARLRAHQQEQEEVRRQHVARLEEEERQKAAAREAERLRREAAIEAQRRKEAEWKAQAQRAHEQRAAEQQQVLAAIRRVPFPAHAFTRIDQYFADSLSDPDSRKVSVVPSGYGSLTCGTINAKNILGGYVGKQPFVAYFNGDGSLAFLRAYSAENLVIVSFHNRSGADLYVQ